MLVFLHAQELGEKKKQQEVKITYNILKIQLK